MQWGQTNCDVQTIRYLPTSFTKVFRIAGNDVCAETTLNASAVIIFIQKSLGSFITYTYVNNQYWNSNINWLASGY